MSQPIRGKGGHLVFPIGPKNTNLADALWTCFLSCFAEFRSVVLEEKSKMSRPIRGKCGHLVFPIGPKNTNLVENVVILLPVKCRWILFSGFRGEVENVSANQRPGRPSCFSDWPEKHKLGRGRWYLASCHVSFNSYSAVSEEKSKMSQPTRGQGGHLVFLDRPEKHKLCRGRWDLASCQVSLNSVQRFQRRSRKCLKPIRGQGGYLVFPIGPKHDHKLAQRVLRSCFLLKFCTEFRISGFREEVENVPGSQLRGQGGLLVFPIGLKSHKLGRGHRDHWPSCQVSLNSVQWFQRRSRKCISQSEARADILFFRFARKTQT